MLLCASASKAVINYKLQNFISPSGKNNKKKGEVVMKYVCDVCGYVYDESVGDPDNGIAAGTKWEDLPEDWVCPLCGVGKEEFSKE